MIKAYKYRIYPTSEQKTQIDNSINVCRLVYNLALDIKIRAYKEHQKKLSTIDLCYQLVDLRQAYSWIKAVDSQSLQASVKSLDNSYATFFSGGGFPKFKSKKSLSQSFLCPNGKREVNWENNTITLPKIKDIPAKLSRKFQGDIKTCTVSRKPSGKYYISILVQNHEELPIKPEITDKTTVGIDMGIKTFVVGSNGLMYGKNRFLQKNLKKLKCLQRRRSRKTLNSKNRIKYNLKVAKLHEKIAACRLDYIHNITKQLTHDSQVGTIVIEDLGVSSMRANHCLAQSVSDVSFSLFFKTLKYKCEWYGKNLIKIGRFDPSSRRCFDCGDINKSLKLSDREWACESCGAIHERDINAANNIKWFGLNSGKGIPVEPVELSSIDEAMKQEYI